MIVKSSWDFSKQKYESSFYGETKPINIWNSYIDNIIILIQYLDEVIRSLLVMLRKMKRYVKKFKVKGGDKNHKLISFHIDDDKL